MTVTQIEPVSGTKSAVYIDGEFAFVLYKGELRKYGISTEKDLPLSCYEEITGEVLPKRAKLRCMNLLTQRPYTRKQLQEKLQQARYPEDIIETALAYVESFGYVDDAAYAVSYVEDNLDRKSIRRITEELARKGIDRAIIEDAVSRVEERDGASNEDAMIRELLRKKNYDPQTADYKEKNRIQAFLYRKGFSPDKIRRAMNCDEEF